MAASANRRWETGGGAYAVIPLQFLLRVWRPGHQNEWGWDAEETSIMMIHPKYQENLVDKMATDGAFWDTPIILGDDGRCWDGHHRILAAVELGWDDIEVELWSSDG